MKAAVNRYTNGLLTAAEFMEFLVNLAREVSADRGRARKLGLSEGPDQAYSFASPAKCSRSSIPAVPRNRRARAGRSSAACSV
ncbi:type I restriction enzyme endonuclease domain-containing protein [Streptomyces sp. IBSBF 2806]|uniref:type I restriction enzyme endonuclease domain-containing protein n=1 Tax=Streptomyces sp. IBSBF 2806 TaxID=2903529 RepID=UPI003FA7ACA8